jgi:F0F1-type ATP synthase assembly protein I
MNELLSATSVHASQFANLCSSIFMPKSSLNAAVCHSCKLCASSILILEALRPDSWGRGVTFDGWQRERGVSGVGGGYIPDLSAHSMILLVPVIFAARLLAKLIVIVHWYSCDISISNNAALLVPMKALNCCCCAPYAATWLTVVTLKEKHRLAEGCYHCKK